MGAANFAGRRPGRSFADQEFKKFSSKKLHDFYVETLGQDLTVAATPDLQTKRKGPPPPDLAKIVQKDCSDLLSRPISGIEDFYSDRRPELREQEIKEGERRQKNLAVLAAPQQGIAKWSTERSSTQAAKA